MSLALHRIVSAIRVEENVVAGVAKIEKYGLNATSSALAVREVVKLDGVMTMNGKATRFIGTQLAMGFTSSLRDVYKLDNIPRSLELRTIEDVKLRPSYSVGEHIRFTENKFKPEISSKLDKEAKRVMSSTDLADEITPAIVERNPVLKRIFDKMSGKKMRTFAGTVLTVGVGIAAVCVAVNEHRNRLTACMLYFYQNNQLQRCAIATCTCKKVDCTKACNYCPPNILAKYLPADMLVDNCGDYTGSSAGCIKCPSDDYNKANVSDDATLAPEDVSKSSFVRCQRPDFFEALTDMFGGVSEDLLDIVKGSLGGISWIVKFLPYIILVTIVGIAIIILISIFGKLNNKKSNISVDDLQPILQQQQPPPPYSSIDNYYG